MIESTEPIDKIKNYFKSLPEGGIGHILVPFPAKQQKTYQFAYDLKIGDIVTYYANSKGNHIFIQKRVPHKKPHHSVIVPVWNRKNIVKECLRRIRKYSKDYELIIVDNGSADGIEEICRKVADKYIRNKYNRGYPVALNQGIKVSEGEYITLISSDVLIFENYLDYLEDCFWDKDNVAFAFPSNLQPPVSQEHVNQLVEEWEEKNPYTGEWLGYMFMTKRDIYEKFGFFNESFEYGMFEDRVMWKKVRDSGMNLMTTRKCWAFHCANMSWRHLYDHQEIFERNKLKYNKLYNENIQKDTDFNVKLGTPI